MSQDDKSWNDVRVGDLDLKVLSNDRQDIYKTCLQDCWNHLVSANPDKGSDPIFLNTSYDYKQYGPLIRTITLTDTHKIFIPVCTCSADDKHYKDVDLVDEVRQPFSGKRKPELKVTIDDAEFGDLDKYYIQPSEFYLDIKEDAKLLNTELYLTHTGIAKAVAAGYGVLIKNLPKRDYPYWVHIRSKLPDGYITEAYYKINVIKRP